MKPSPPDPDPLVLQFGSRERDLLLSLLQHYPLVPAAHHRLSRKSDDPRAQENQHLLEQAVAEQRAANQRQLQALLQAPDTWLRRKHGWTFRLKRPDAEWFLQVLNDIRVGCWLLLGSPEDPVEPADLSEELFGCCVTMEIVGVLQMALLDALGRGGPPTA